MVSAFSLWMPILLSAVLVFVASSLIHMVLGYHANDVKAVPQQDAFMDAVRPFNLPPGDYCVPRPGSMKELGSPEYKARMEKGPNIVFTVMPPGASFMGVTLVKWFVYSIVVSFVVAYVTGVALPPGAKYPQVFRMAATVGFTAYALAMPQFSIWYRRHWGTTLLSMLDGFIYGCLIGGTFGWLWPR